MNSCVIAPGVNADTDSETLTRSFFNLNKSFSLIHNICLDNVPLSSRFLIPILLLKGLCHESELS